LHEKKGLSIDKNRALDSLSLFIRTAIYCAVWNESEHFILGDPEQAHHKCTWKRLMQIVDCYSIDLDKPDDKGKTVLFDLCKLVMGSDDSSEALIALDIIKKLVARGCNLDFTVEAVSPKTMLQEKAEASSDQLEIVEKINSILKTDE
jgi:hypothetical protein